MREIIVKHILNVHKKRDPWFLDNYSVNPYTGCKFSCVYCYVKGGKYGSAKLAVKINAAKILAKELKNLATDFVAIGTSTEPWQFIEEKYKVTRACLQVLAKKRFPVHALTKSPLILRDVDLLKEISKDAELPNDLKNVAGCMVTISFSCLDEKTKKIFEPNAPSIEERIATAKALSEEGIWVNLALIPALPGISDNEETFEKFCKIAREIGAKKVFFGALTLNGQLKDFFLSFIAQKFPGLVEKYYSIYPSPEAFRKYEKQITKKASKIAEKYGYEFPPRW